MSLARGTGLGPYRTGPISLISIRVTPGGKAYAGSMYTASSELCLREGLN